MLFLLAGTILMIYYADYRLIYERSQDLLRNYCEDYGSGGDTADGHTLPPPDKKDGERENASAVRQIYSVFFSGDGSVKAVDLGKVSLYSGKEISDAACRAKNGKENAGRTGKFFYRIERQGDGLLVALINIAFEDEARTLMIRYTVIFGGIAMGFTLVFSFLVSKKIVTPLEENDRMQKQFISDEGHELKTPISVISANLELLEREDADNIWLKNIRYENEKMGELVKELLTLARLEQTVPVMEELDFSRLLMRELLTFESMAYEKRIQLNYDEIAENTRLFGSREQLSGLVAILIENAIAYSAKGECVFVCLKNGQKDICFSVTNTGTEITEEQREHLFDRFYRTDFSRDNENNHYGLGLAIAKKIVELHRARIEVRCEKKCVTFLVTFEKKV